VGYVDLSGHFSNLAASQNGGSPDSITNNKFLHFADEDAAKNALNAGSIKAFFVIQADYLQSGNVRLVAIDAPSEDVQSQFKNLIRRNLLAGQPPSVARRILDGGTIVVKSLDGKRSMSPGQWLDVALPLAAGLLFVLAVNTSGGYLLQAVVDEKENRTMEIVVTSVSADQLMAGKIAGNLSVGLTQLMVWVLMGSLLVWLVQVVFPVQTLQVSRLFVWVMFLTLLPAFVMVAALMAAIGATTTESREAQQIAALFTLPIFIPYWMVTVIMASPSGPVATLLSIFPLTAPVTLPLRAVFSDPPIWQVALAIGLLFVCAAGAVWLAGRAFRLGMLRYGKRLSWRELFKPA
jgi:ABC-2 type transport system permease protein